MTSNQKSLVIFEHQSIQLWNADDHYTFAWGELEAGSSVYKVFHKLLHQRYVKVLIHSDMLLLNRMQAPQSLWQRLKISFLKSAQANIQQSNGIDRNLYGLWLDADQLVFCYPLNDQLSKFFADFNAKTRNYIHAIEVITDKTFGTIQSSLTSSTLRAKSGKQSKVFRWLYRRKTGYSISFNAPKINHLIHSTSNVRFLTLALALCIPALSAIVLHKYEHAIVPAILAQIPQPRETADPMDMQSYQMKKKLESLTKQIDTLNFAELVQQRSNKKYMQLNDLNIPLQLEQISYGSDFFSLSGTIESIELFYEFTEKLSEYGGVVSMRELKKINNNQYFFTIHWDEQ